MLLPDLLGDVRDLAGIGDVEPEKLGAAPELLGRGGAELGIESATITAAPA